jgi:hypothetical protein
LETIFFILPKSDGCHISLPNCSYSTTIHCSNAIGLSCTPTVFLSSWSWKRHMHLQKFAKFYLANLVFCQLLKIYDM